MMTPRERFERDSMFRALVSQFESLIHNAHFTPTEIREAAMLAQIHYEERNPRRVYFMQGENIFDSLERQR